MIEHQQVEEVKKPDPEIQRAKLAKAKEIYMQMPRERDAVMASEIDWPKVTELGLLERVVRPWVGKKIKELLGVEEQTMISLVVGHLRNGKATPASMLSKVCGILDEDSDEFVFRLWQVLLFEDLKVKGGLV